MTKVVKVTIQGEDDDTIIFTGLVRDAYELLGGWLGKEPVKKEGINWEMEFNNLARMVNDERLLRDAAQRQQTIQWTPVATTYEGITRSINAEWANRITESFNAPSPFYTTIPAGTSSF